MLTKTLTKPSFSGKIQNADVANCLTFQTYQNGRGVAQLGSALGSGPRGREFKSPLPDHFVALVWIEIFGGDVPKQALGSGRGG